jgi:hypothetical protein
MFTTQRHPQTEPAMLQALSRSWCVLSKSYLDCVAPLASLTTRPFAINQEAGT